jgi:alkanesulfonate monooxygenase SsuD/methylene tetrahydromethanopterin reductase-like flavin-dependent oxidoreductase (luciferase family)
MTAAPDGRPHSQAQVIREVIEQGVLADQVGVDVIGLGEHHRPDFAISTPDIVLAAIAG